MSAPRVLARVPGIAGELVLRESDGCYEVICDGIFLMDTRCGRSERLLVQAALQATPTPRRMLIGGLGVGFSLHEALADPRVEQITVLEREPAVVAWHHTHLAPISAGALLDPRVRVVVDDLVSWLGETTEQFDAVCLDVDNGPDWTVGPGNHWLYEPDGLALLSRRLTGTGVLSVWSAAPAPGFSARLQSAFAAVDQFEVAVPRGAPDVVYLAHQAEVGQPAPHDPGAPHVAHTPGG